MTWTATILTLFPDAFPGPLDASLIGKARKDSVWRLETVDIRDFSSDKHASVDTSPAGGGPGMVMRADVVAAAVDSVDRGDRPLVYLTPRGAPLSQERVKAWAGSDGLVLLCGRFEGVDERVLEARPFAEVSLGDFVLAGGEIAAMAAIEACVRLLPGALGAAASVEEESFEDGLLEYPQYARPRVWDGREIPEVLLSGDHAKIAKWRRDMAERITRERRPDLWAARARGGNTDTKD